MWSPSLVPYSIEAQQPPDTIRAPSRQHTNVNGMRHVLRGAESSTRSWVLTTLINGNGLRSLSCLPQVPSTVMSLSICASTNETNAFPVQPNVVFLLTVPFPLDRRRGRLHNTVSQGYYLFEMPWQANPHQRTIQAIWTKKNPFTLTHSPTPTWLHPDLSPPHSGFSTGHTKRSDHADGHSHL